MNPILKQHIETYIDDIEKGNVTTSIFYCPLDIVEEYVDALNKIGMTFKSDYVYIATTLAKQLHKGRWVKTDYGIGSQLYVFEFPLQMFDYPDLQRRLHLLSNSQQSYYVERMNTDITLGTTTIEVKSINMCSF